MTEADWDGYRKTTRSVDTSDSSHKAGSYGANVRRRGKREGGDRPSCPVAVR